MAVLAAALLATVVLLGAGEARAGDRKRMAPGSIEPAVLYHNYCSVCHGDAGDGNSRAKASLIPRPADFTDIGLQGKLTREYIAAIVRHGKPGTAMVGYTAQLGDKEIEALAGYVRAAFVERAGDVAVRRGRTLYGHYCVNCHGVTGEKMARDIDRDRVIAAVAIGRRGTDMPGFAGQLAPADIEAVADYLHKSLFPANAGAISGVSAHGGRERDPK